MLLSMWCLPNAMYDHYIYYTYIYIYIKKKNIIINGSYKLFPNGHHLVSPHELHLLIYVIQILDMTADLHWLRSFLVLDGARGAEGLNTLKYRTRSLGIIYSE